MRKTAVQFGLYYGCGFRLFLHSHPRVTDAELLMALSLDSIVRLDPDQVERTGRRVMAITEVGSWTLLADDYGLWNRRQRRRAAVAGLARLGDLFTFQLPDPDMAYAFALYRGGERVRLRVVDSPSYSDQILRLDEGTPLAGEPADWRGEPLPMMVSIVRALGIDADADVIERFYGWGDGATR